MSPASRDSLVDLFKQSATAMLEQARRQTPDESPFALLFEISDGSAWSAPFYGTNESLARRVEEMIGRGYGVKTGDPRQVLAARCRWEAPGDTEEWYWGHGPVHEALAAHIKSLFKSKYDPAAYDEVQQSCLRALGELSAANVFGTGTRREQLLIGPTCVEMDFAEFVDILANINPPATIERLKSQLAEADANIDNIIYPPPKPRPR